MICSHFDSYMVRRSAPKEAHDRPLPAPGGLTINPARIV
jgi:hypothetical protein